MTRAFRSLLALAAGLALALGASAQQAPAASTYYGENATRIKIDANTYGAASGNGGYLGHAEAQAGASASGIVSQTAGAFVLKADASGYGNAVAYNTVVGNAFGSANAGGWSDASLRMNAAAVDAHGYVQGAGVADGGMYDAVRNGVDFHVNAGTAQDGAVKTDYAGGFQINGNTSQTPINGGAAIALNVTATQYTDGTVNVGAVNFAGGAPVGQTAASRGGNTGFVVNVTADGFDPAH